MRKMLIVDDEIDTLQGLATCIDWKSMGIDEVRTATNGELALAAAKEFAPHIVLSDIAMPRMNGVDFAKELAKVLPNTRVVFITGYWEEEYLKSAFKTRVVDYILKPIDPQELQEVVLGIVREQEKETEKEKYLQLLEERVRNTLPAMRDHLFLSLIRGHYPSSEFLRQRFSLVGAPPVSAETYWASVALRVEECPWFENGGAVNLGLLDIALADTAEQCIQELGLYGCCFHDRNRDFACVVSKSNNVGGDFFSLESAMTDFCLAMHKTLEQSLQIRCTMGVGEWVNDPLLLHFSWGEAEKCLAQSFAKGQNSIIWASRLHNSIPPQLSYYGLKVEEIAQQVQRGNTAQALSEIDALFSSLRFEMGTDAYHCRALCVQLYITITNVLIESACATQEDLAQISDHVGELFVASNLTVIQDLIQSLCRLVCERLAENSSRENKIVAEVKRVIEESYRKNISIRQLADQVFVSPSYLCLLFKQETGYTINEYLTKVRIDKAVYLLDNTDQRIIDICYDVGYRDTKYFSRLFKKATGTLPSEYRKAHENG